MTAHPPSDANKRPATSRDVAHLAGVSRTTVSYVLNNTPGVKLTEATKEAVLKAAADLHYRPNPLARSLVSKSGPLVIVMPRLPLNEMIAAMLADVTTELFRRGFITTVVQVHDDVEMAFETIAGFQPRAAIFVSDTWDDLIARLEEQSIQVISLGHRGAALDQHSLGFVQTSHLLERGHSRLAFADAEESGQIGAPPRSADAAAASQALGIDSPEVAIVPRDGTGAAQIVREWHAAGVTAVCAFNDEVALAVLFGIREAGLRCPEDIAVIGCDDIPASAVAYPPLTTLTTDMDLAKDSFVWVILTALGVESPPPVANPLALRVVQREST
ncbi:MAG: LacI family transcriptional regulator [Ruaniaceae bacterium]|nr:LacI family transcriptional regulator [Ruaniaceae bacterium]